MNRKIALKWAKALESGNYQQTSGYLHDGQGFCCLGVLCDIYSNDNTKTSWKTRDPAFSFLGESALLPDDVYTWAEMASSTGNLAKNKSFSYNSLAEANDSGTSFVEIAKIIRKHSEVL